MTSRRSALKAILAAIGTLVIPGRAMLRVTNRSDYVEVRGRKVSFTRGNECRLVGVLRVG